MKINEVEALVGITKKNIRFYEEQGLLKPGRNSLKQKVCSRPAGTAKTDTGSMDPARWPPCGRSSC